MRCNVNNSFYIPDSWVEVLFRPHLQSVVMSIVEPPIGIIGVFLNLLFIVVVNRSKKMQSNTNLYLVNLAIADSLYLAYSTWHCLANYFSSPFLGDHKFLGPIGCPIDAIMIYTNYFASLFLVGAVTFERYAAVCRPLTHRAVATKSRTVNMIVLCWASALVCGAFMSIQLFDYTEDCMSYSPKYSHLPQTLATCHAPWSYESPLRAIHYHGTPLVEVGAFQFYICR